MSRQCRNAGAPAPSPSPGPGEARVRRWAPRVRTGCTTCRTRHVKCDETRPVCGPCHRGHRDCRYTLPPPVQAGFASSQKSWPRRQAFPVDIEPVDWEFQEAFRFYFQVILPSLSPESQTIPLRCFTDANFPRVTFSGSMARAHIERASQARGRVLCPGEDPSFQASWVRFFHTVALHIRTIHEQLLRDDDAAAAPATHPMLELLLFDLAVQGSAWTAHVRGFLAYVASRGGVSEMMRLPEPEKLCVAHILSFTLQASTTCPAHQQIRGSDGFSDQDITALLAFTPHAAEPCPVAFHLARAHITRLRVSLARSHVPASASVALAVQDIFDTLWWFDLDRYVEQNFGDKGSEAQEQARIMGRVYAVAIRLYGILTLSPSSISAWAVSSLEIEASFPAISECSHENLRRRHCDELLGMLREYWDAVILRKWLSWPLVVLGVAVADDAADKEFVEASLTTIWSSIAALEKLRVFWQSGKTGWEDCFDEPVPFVIW